MPIRHQLTDTDTVEYLALQYLGDPSRWRDIVDYNKLVYPYISDDPADKLAVYASGYITLSRDVATQPITLRSGWSLHTQRNIMSSALKSYLLVDDVLMDVGVTTIHAFIRSIVPGVQGNTSQGVITKLGDEFISNGFANITVTNDAPITNGVEGFIRTTGEYLFIPTDEDTATMQTNGSGFSYNEIEYFYGSDLQMEFDDLVINEVAGDLGIISYTDNVKQALNRRLSSEKGDTLTDFNFGNRITEIIGDTKLPWEAKRRLIQVSILENVNYEDRVKDPVINSIVVDQLNRCCYVDFTVTVVKLGSAINFDNMKIGGMF